MDSLRKSQHISQRFGEELEGVRNKVIAMGGLVETQLVSAIKSMLEGDTDLAQQATSSDGEINAMEVDIDDECVRILARRQPAASDLRLVMTVVKMVTDLERIGDEGKRVAKMAALLQGDRFIQTTMAEVEHMGELVGQMLASVLDAFARTDVDQAVRVVQQDTQVDRRYQALTEQLVAMMEQDRSDVATILNILWALRALERIGDRCKNIAEYVIYLVKGKDVRHTSMETILAQAQRAPE